MSALGEVDKLVQDAAPLLSFTCCTVTLSSIARGEIDHVLGPPVQVTGAFGAHSVSALAMRVSLSSIDAT